MFRQTTALAIASLAIAGLLAGCGGDATTVDHGLEVAQEAEQFGGEIEERQRAIEDGLLDRTE